MRDLILTGIPRSGTSYLCTLLNKIDDHVVINEPYKLEHHINFDENLPTNLDSYYQLMRQKVEQGEPIENKTSEDTLFANDRHLWRPDNLSGADFVFGLKITFKFVFALSRLRERKPTTKIVALIRHPYNNLSAWKASFPHLREGVWDSFLCSDIYRRYCLSAEERTIQDQMAMIKEASIRRCLLWHCAAGAIARNLDHITVMRYEDLIADPVREICTAFDLPTARVAPLISKSQKPPRPLDLSAEDYKNIHKICKESAERLGYTLGKEQNV